MSNVVIVAIPYSGDDVYKASSEKVPHLTLLDLGENLSKEDASKIAEFLEHAAKMTMPRFTAWIDKRGTLGDKNADVVFFQKEESEDAVDPITWFRSILLQDPTIQIAHNTTEQFSEYTPHLTLGFPETPAKQGPTKYPDKNWVSFDKVALWTEDYDGPTFELEMTLEMSSKGESLTATDSFAEVALKHHGVKGMRWGVRKDRGSGGGRASTVVFKDRLTSPSNLSTVGPKTDTLKSSSIRRHLDFAKSLDESFLSVIKRENSNTQLGLAKADDSPEYHEAAKKHGGYDKVPQKTLDSIFDKYGREGLETDMQALLPKGVKLGRYDGTEVYGVGDEKSLKDHKMTIVPDHPGTAKTRRKVQTRRRVVQAAGFTAGFAVTATAISTGSAILTHAEEEVDPGLYTVELNRKGLTIEGFNVKAHYARSQTPLEMSDLIENFLQHHGVKGMKWGIRKPRGSSSGGSGEASEPRLKRKKPAAKQKIASPNGSVDKRREQFLKTKSASDLSNIELRFLNERAKLESEYARLRASQTKLARANDKFNKALDYTQTINKAIAFANSPAGKLIIGQVSKKLGKKDAGDAVGEAVAKSAEKVSDLAKKMEDMKVADKASAVSPLAKDLMNLGKNVAVQKRESTVLEKIIQEARPVKRKS